MAKRKAPPQRSEAGPLRISAASRLEIEATRQLQCPGVIQLGCNLADRCISYRRVWIAELHTVEQVEGLHANVEGHALVDGEVLIERHVPVGLARTAQEVVRTRLVAKLEAVEIWVGSTVGERGRTLANEARGVEVCRLGKLPTKPVIHASARGLGAIAARGIGNVHWSHGAQEGVC